MLDFEVKFYAIDPDLFYALSDVFHCVPQVTCHLGSILKSQADTLVSPANSFGFMDGGIDQVYSDYFGPRLEKGVQGIIQNEYYGELTVGQAFVIDLPLAEKTFKRMIVAPTMRVPDHLRGTANAYLAFRAVLISAISFNAKASAQNRIKVIACPGLGTGIGDLSARSCAHQVFEAYQQVTGAKPFPKSVFHAFNHHQRLIRK